MAKKKNIVVITTPPWALQFISVTDMLTDEELAQARLERPDLIFTLASQLPKEEEIKPVPVEDVSKGITVTGMTLPADFEDRVKSILGDI